MSDIQPPSEALNEEKRSEEVLKENLIDVNNNEIQKGSESVEPNGPKDDSNGDIKNREKSDETINGDSKDADKNGVGTENIRDEGIEQTTEEKSDPEKSNDTSQKPSPEETTPNNAETTSISNSHDIQEGERANSKEITKVSDIISEQDSIDKNLVIPTNTNSDKEANNHGNSETELQANVASDKEVQSNSISEKEAQNNVVCNQKAQVNGESVNDSQANIGSDKEALANVGSDIEAPANVGCDKNVPASVDSDKEVPTNVDSNKDISINVDSDKESRSDVDIDKDTHNNINNQQETHTNINGEKDSFTDTDSDKELSSENNESPSKVDKIPVHQGIDSTNYGSSDIKNISSEVPKVPPNSPPKTNTVFEQTKESKNNFKPVMEEKREEEPLRNLPAKEPEVVKEKSNDILGTTFDSKWDKFPTSEEFRSLYGEEIWEQLQGSYNDLAKTLKVDENSSSGTTQKKKEKRFTCWDRLDLENNIDPNFESPSIKRPRESQESAQDSGPKKLGRPPGIKNGAGKEPKPAEDKIKCHLCENAFDSIAQARAHLLIHSGIKPFKCSKCDYRSYSRFNVTNNHWSNKHERKGDVNDVDVDEDQKEKMKNFVIKESEKMLSGNHVSNTSQQDIKTNEDAKTTEKVEEEPEPKKPKTEPPVPHTPRPYQRKNTPSNKHKDGPVKCHLCDKSFELLILAKGHLQVHSGIKPYKCLLCDYKSYSKNNVMNNHMSNHHGKKGNNDDVETDMDEKLNLKKFVIEESEKMQQTNNEREKAEKNENNKTG